jgi:predicted cupin superfamily sugar epimerase
MTTAREWIEHLRLVPHPEGGYYRETHRSGEVLTKESLPDRFNGPRSFSTAIYFLLTSDDFSALHRIKQDEIWHFYDGSPLTLHVINPAGGYAAIRLGRNWQAGQVPQATVPAGHLFGATVDGPRSYSLVGCTVAPGFDFADFEMLSREILVRQYPQHQSIIERVSR